MPVPGIHLSFGCAETPSPKWFGSPAVSANAGFTPSAAMNESARTIRRSSIAPLQRRRRPESDLARHLSWAAELDFFAVGAVEGGSQPAGFGGDARGGWVWWRSDGHAFRGQALELS